MRNCQPENRVGRRGVDCAGFSQLCSAVLQWIVYWIFGRGVLSLRLQAEDKTWELCECPRVPSTNNGTWLGIGLRLEEGSLLGADG